MNSKTLQALRASIDHWNENIKLVQEGYRPEIISQKCALCGLFNTATTRAKRTACLECPVYQKTGARYCADTPYHEIGEFVKDAVYWDDAKPDILPQVVWMRDILVNLLPENTT